MSQLVDTCTKFFKKFNGRGYVSNKEMTYCEYIN